MQTGGGMVNMRYAMTENQRVDRIVCGTRVLRVGRTRDCFSKGASENGRSRRTNQGHSWLEKRVGAPGGSGLLS